MKRSRRPVWRREERMTLLRGDRKGREEKKWKGKDTAKIHKDVRPMLPWKRIGAERFVKAEEGEKPMKWGLEMNV